MQEVECHVKVPAIFRIFQHRPYKQKNDLRLLKYTVELFKQKKVSESTPPDCDDIHIMMDIYGTEILIGPGNVAGTGFENTLCCEIRFDKEDDFHQAYDENKQGCSTPLG